MSDGGEMDDDVGLDLGEQRRQGMVVAGIENVNRDLGRVQQVETLVNEMQIERAIADIVGVDGKGGEVVDLEAVDDLDIGAHLLERQRHVMTDEAGAAGDDDAAASDGIDHGFNSEIA